jgi:hypothetical protein
MTFCVVFVNSQQNRIHLITKKANKKNEEIGFSISSFFLFVISDNCQSPKHFGALGWG